MMALRAGGIVAYPTEGVYGLGCDPDDQRSVTRLAGIKHRNPGQGFILIACSLEQVAPLVKLPDGEMAEVLRTSWPGHTTWVFLAADRVPDWLTGQGRTLAARVTAHPTAAALCRCFGGPIISTSANRRGLPPARTALAVRLRLPRNSFDYVLSGRVSANCGPSEIRDIRDNRVIRPGAGG